MNAKQGQEPSGEEMVAPTATSSLIQNLIQQTQKEQKAKSRFQMTAYDILFNPLRAEHPFGKFYPLANFAPENWSPREISKFQACFLMFGKNFGEYKIHVSLIKALNSD